MSAPEHEQDGTWVRVCAVDEVVEGEGFVFRIVPPVAVFNLGGDLTATDDTCTHSTSSLVDEGYVDGETIECGYHFATFCLRTGSVLKAPASKPLRTWPVDVRDGQVWIDVTGHESAGLLVDDIGAAARS